MSAAMQNQQILGRISKLEQELRDIKRLLKMSALVYGSDAWWRQEILMGEKEIGAGNYKIYKKASNLVVDLHKGK